MVDQTVQLNFLSRADGSAFYTIGGGFTSVLATINGPISTKHSNRLHNKCALEVFFFPVNGQPMVGDRSVESVISDCVELILARHLHPRACITLTVQELQSQYKQLLLAASINASCFALLDAGVQLQGLLAAVCCCYDRNTGVIQLWPTYLQAKESDNMFTVVFESHSLEVVNCFHQGPLSPELHGSCLAQCQEAAKTIFSFYRKEMNKKFSDSEVAIESERFLVV